MAARLAAGYIAESDALKSLGVEEIMCVTPNDKFVTKAWAKDQGAGDKVTVVADGNTTLAKALGQPFDMQDIGFGQRSNRFAMHIVDGEVKVLNAESNPGEFEVSDAANMVKSLRA
jgi:peroxiredoxin